MSTIYLVPANGDMSTLTETLARASVPFEHPATLRDFILAVEGHDMVVAALEEKTLLLLTRYADECLVDLPTAVNSVPGLFYSRDWGRVTTSLPFIDWIDLKKLTAKSGHTAFSTDQLAKRAGDLPAVATGPAVGVIDDEEDDLGEDTP